MPSSTHSLPRDVADDIRERIFTGRVQGGERVSEELVASELGVTRRSVRDVIDVLESDGLLEKGPYPGAFVVPITAEDIEDHYAMCGAITAMAAARAATRIRPAKLDGLQTLHAEIQATDDLERLEDLHRSFHSTVAHIGASRRLTSVLRHMDRYLPRAVLAISPPNSALATCGHEAILAALGRGDAAAADTACRAHARTDGLQVVAALAAAGVLADLQPVPPRRAASQPGARA